MNVQAFQPLELFEKKIEAYVHSLKDVPLAAGHDQIYYPGEMENLANIKNRQEGLILPIDTLESLKELAIQANLTKALPTELQDE
jgi:LDH2 family malate/lactate/ureidoglycolate dehydrogenase